jgi:predicted MPP superfamily phosphohydrolase
MMGKLVAKFGKFATYGNYDISYCKNLNLMKNSGFRILDGDLIKISTGRDILAISGVSMMKFRDLISVKEKLDSNLFNIFLHHSPAMVESFDKVKPDLYLCGHIHGGQVALPFYGAIITFGKFGKKYERGLYRVNGINLYVNRGIGMEGGWAPRVRFFSPPEVTVIDIIPK